MSDEGGDWTRMAEDKIQQYVSDGFAYFFTQNMEVECQALSDYRCYSSQNCTLLPMYRISELF
jgi:hypothetical protein